MKSSVTVSIRQFAPNEAMLLAEASDLGIPVGVVPDFINVEGTNGEDAQFHLRATKPEGWEYELTGFGQLIENCGEDGPSMWCPRKMVVLND